MNWTRQFLCQSLGLTRLSWLNPCLLGQLRQRHMRLGHGDMGTMRLIFRKSFNSWEINFWKDFHFKKFLIHDSWILLKHSGDFEFSEWEKKISLEVANDSTQVGSRRVTSGMARLRGLVEIARDNFTCRQHDASELESTSSIETVSEIENEWGQYRCLCFLTLNWE